MGKDELRLIEDGFPCRQVGAETQRERDTGLSPALNRLHVWWARRPLTASRAAILASSVHASLSPMAFLEQLGITRKRIVLDGIELALPTEFEKKILTADGKEGIRVDRSLLRYLEREQGSRAEQRAQLESLLEQNKELASEEAFSRWQEDVCELPALLPTEGSILFVVTRAANPDHAQLRIALEARLGIRTKQDKYGYPRAFTKAPCATVPTGLRVLDPTSGGGSIGFEAMRLGHEVIANELNPVATLTLHAGLDFPVRYGRELSGEIAMWGGILGERLRERMQDLFPQTNADEELDGFLFLRQGRCPSCAGELVLLNSLWLSRKKDNAWAVKLETDGKPRNGCVTFNCHRVQAPASFVDTGTVKRAIGRCLHCDQKVESAEIQAQARGESQPFAWKDRLYAVCTISLETLRDENGIELRYKSGKKKGQLRQRKRQSFRAPNRADLQALDVAERRLARSRQAWEDAGFLPTEGIPDGEKTGELLRYGMRKWGELFTARQSLGLVSLLQDFHALAPRIIDKHGKERGRAILTYLQFVIDKCADYNSRQTRWHFSRGILVGSFGRHDFSFKWSYGEMILTGKGRGYDWALGQVVDAYRELTKQTKELFERFERTGQGPVRILHGSAAQMPSIESASIDLVCMDPPYYGNVQYAELSDFYYVWQKRGVGKLWPELFELPLSNKSEEAVANSKREGSGRKAKQNYEDRMREIFLECRRVLKGDGIMTLMFTHKTQDAWESLTRSLIESGWRITASFPVESESKNSLHQRGLQAARASIFLSCRKRTKRKGPHARWTGDLIEGVCAKIQVAVEKGLLDFAELSLGPVDELAAAWGRALAVLSEHWPVYDREVQVGPKRAMAEASRIVTEKHDRRQREGVPSA